MNKLLISLALGAPLFAQPAFDVVSVKANKTADRPVSNVPMGPGNAYTPNGGRFSATGFPLVGYIAFAYKVTGNQAESLLAQLPAWATTEHFDIEAKVDGNPTKDEMRLMMRALLAGRFKLDARYETKEMAVGAFVLVKPHKLGPQLQPHPSEEPCPLDAAAGLTTPDERFPLLCGGMVPMKPSVPGRVRHGGRNVTLDFIATSLSGGAGFDGPLVDRTGLEGKFDFSLEWTPEIRGPVKPGVEEKLDHTGPTFEQALREQLGFKLQSQKAPLTMLVISHVEHPSDN
jgi:uncharacterized protein (TIGR03435 family)